MTNTAKKLAKNANWTHNPAVVVYHACRQQPIQYQLLPLTFCPIGTSLPKVKLNAVPANCAVTVTMSPITYRTTTTRGDNTIPSRWNWASNAGVAARRGRRT